MESIKLENVNDAIKRENLFKKVAMKVLNEIEFKKVDQNFTGEKLRTRRELDDLENKFKDQDPEKKRKYEKKIEKKVKEEGDEESFEEEELTTKERRLKNKKTYHQTKGQRKKKLKSRKKANRRKNR